MRLSDAIGLGRTLVKFDSTKFLWPNDKGECVGCAIGMGLAAIGEVKIERLDQIFVHWPWLNGTDDWTAKPITIISEMAHRVAKGEQSLDELIDYVRSVEPAEETFLPENVQEPEYASVT
jgi:hypothetical protein